MDGDDLYAGPSVLAPGASDRSRTLASKLLIPLHLLFLGIVLLFYVFFTVFAVKGPSMEPTLLEGDRVLVTKSYREPSRGDVVVFAAFDRENREEDLIKRVVAVPGDTVEVRQGIAIVNGVVEPTPSIDASSYDETYLPATTVPTGHVFVMGDNRPVSLDSRQLGPVPLSSVQGRAVLVFAPLDRIMSLR